MMHLGKCAGLLLAMAAVPANAGNLDLDLTVAAGLWSRDFNLPADPWVTAASLKAGARWTPSDTFAARTELRAYTTLGADAPRQRADLRTATIAIDHGRLALRLGRQIEVWGRADRLNPTDSLSPRDYRILTSEDDDQRLGLAMARADFAVSDRLQFRTYWIPEFRPTTLIFPLAPQITRDDRNSDPGQFALKLDSSGGAFDWSLSWYQGRDRIYDLALTPTLTQRYNSITVLGADIAGAAGPWGWRTEAAYTTTRFDPAHDPLVRRPDLWLVAGLDRNFNGNIYANLQFSIRQILAFNTPVDPQLQRLRQQIDILRFQQDQTQFGLTGTIRHHWSDRRWTAEALALHYIQRSQGVIRLELRHQLTPTLNLRARAQKIYGPQNSYFGRVAPASAISIEARASF